LISISQRESKSNNNGWQKRSIYGKYESLQMVQLRLRRAQIIGSSKVYLLLAEVRKRGKEQITACPCLAEAQPPPNKRIKTAVPSAQRVLHKYKEHIATADAKRQNVK
jgi:hypothetical protein